MGMSPVLCRGLLFNACLCCLHACAVSSWQMHRFPDETGAIDVPAVSHQASTPRQMAFTSRGETETGDAVPWATGLAPYRMALQNYEDMQYPGELQVGGQKLRGVFDTGSFELLVFSRQCTMCGSTDLLYDHTLSNDYVSGSMNQTHSFGSGDTWSHEASDRVAVGPGLVAQSQSFWEVTDTMMPVLQSATFQAIVGVGPPTSAEKLAEERLNRAVAERDVLRSQGKTISADVREEVRESRQAAKHAKRRTSLAANLGVRRFSVCIGSNNGDPGVFVWNDEDPRNKQYFVHVPIEGKIHWGVRMTDVRIGQNHEDSIIGCTPELDVGDAGNNTNRTSGGSCGAVIDSGTSLIAAPKDAIDRVARALERLGGDCSRINELPDLVFTLGGSEFSLPPESYVGQVEGSVPSALNNVLHFEALRDGQSGSQSSISCQPLLMTVDTYTQFGPMWILGLPFFRRYYTTFEVGDQSNHLFASVADDQCKPGTGTSLLQPVRKHKMMKVDASKIRVPRWVRDAASKRHFDL